MVQAQIPALQDPVENRIVLAEVVKLSCQARGFGKSDWLSALPCQRGNLVRMMIKARLQLGDSRFGNKKHHAGNAIYVKTLEEAAVLIGKGFSL